MTTKPTRRRLARFSIRADDLAEWLWPVFPFAGTDTMLPVLTTIAFRGHGSVVSATATDRFRAGMSVHQLAQWEGEPRNAATFDTTLIGAAALKQALSLFKPKRGHYSGDALTVTVRADGITLEGFAPIVGRLSLTLNTMDGTYPDIWKLIAEGNRGREVDAKAATAVGLNPKFLAELAAALTLPGRRSSTWSEPVTLRMGDDPRRPIGFSTSTFVGILMPKRFLEGNNTHPDGTPVLSDAVLAALPQPDATERKVAA